MTLPNIKALKEKLKKNDALRDVVHKARWAIRAMPLTFFVHKKMFYNNFYRPAPCPDEYQNTLKTLREDGLVIIENYMSVKDTAKIRKDVEPHLRALKDGSFKGKNKVYAKPASGLFRLMEVDKISETALKFYDDPMIMALAKSYVSEDVQSYQRMAELKDGIGRMNNSDYTHFDDWRIRFKAFLLLTDVTEETAPFVYYRRSHLQKPWRFMDEYRYFRDHKEGSYGMYTPYIVEGIARRNNLERVAITGKAGTMFLVDTRGLHSGTPPISGERILLANYFDVRPGSAGNKEMHI